MSEATSEEKQLTPAQESCLRELLLRGIAEVGEPADLTAESLIPVLRAGLRACEKFTQELIEGRTERAILFREVLTTEVYVRCVKIGARERLLKRAEERALHENVRRTREELGL